MWQFFSMELVQFGKKSHFGESLFEIILDMVQWFKISCCLKIYSDLVLVASCPVQQSILVFQFGRGSFEALFCDIIWATDSESCLNV